MNNNKSIMKAIALSLGLAAAMLPVSNVSAQGVFGNLLDNYYEEQDYAKEGALRRGNSGYNSSLTLQNFGSGEGTFGNLTLQNFGESQDNNITLQNFGEEAPLGNGLFFLLATSAGYAALKSKKNNKKQIKSIK